MTPVSAATDVTDAVRRYDNGMRSPSQSVIFPRAKHDARAAVHREATGPRYVANGYPKQKRVGTPCQPSKDESDLVRQRLLVRDAVKVRVREPADVAEQLERQV